MKMSLHMVFVTYHSFNVPPQTPGFWCMGAKYNAPGRCRWYTLFNQTQQGTKEYQITWLGLKLERTA